MKQRFRLYRRRNGGRFYLHDGLTGKQESLHTFDREVARRLLHSKNEAEKQPAVNLQIARAYLATVDPAIGSRTWSYVMDEIVKLKQGETARRWQVAVKDRAFDSLRNLVILETRGVCLLLWLKADPRAKVPRKAGEDKELWESALWQACIDGHLEIVKKLRPTVLSQPRICR